MVKTAQFPCYSVFRLCKVKQRIPEIIVYLYKSKFKRFSEPAYQSSIYSVLIFWPLFAIFLTFNVQVEFFLGLVSRVRAYFVMSPQILLSWLLSPNFPNYIIIFFNVLPQISDGQDLGYHTWFFVYMIHLQRFVWQELFGPDPHLFSLTPTYRFNHWIAKAKDVIKYKIK